MQHNLNQVIEILLIAKKHGVNLAEAFGPRYALRLHDHDTGTHVKITALLGDEELCVYEHHRWKSSQYDFNNRDKILGLQIAGPWSDEIDSILDDIRMDTHNKIVEERQAELAKERAAQRTYDEKVARFRAAFAKAEAA
jgi:hypothetical protein